MADLKELGLRAFIDYVQQVLPNPSGVTVALEMSTQDAKRLLALIEDDLWCPQRPPTDPRSSGPILPAGIDGGIRYLSEA